MIFEGKPVWNLAPRLQPKITMSLEASEIGKNKIAKFSPSPCVRVFSLSYYLRDLAAVREAERFFIARGGRLESFYLPSFKRDFIPSNKFANQSAFSCLRANASFGIWGQGCNIYIPKEGFAARVLDIKVDSQNNQEIIALKQVFNFEINPQSFISELICVRFNSDEISISKSGAVGFSMQLDLKEVFYE